MISVKVNFDPALTSGKSDAHGKDGEGGVWILRRKKEYDSYRRIFTFTEVRVSLAS
jgi:hypothetical protein